MPYGTLASDVLQSSTAGTPPQFNDGNGTQIGTLCRAWVNFNGTTASPSTINASFNTTSITKNSTGNYTLNFTNALPDTNYAVFFGICGGTSATNASFVGSVLAVTQYGAPSLKSTTQVQIITVDYTSTVRDFTQVYVSVFR